MANSFFKFKQFTIFHDKCAMKVGTDGVLLGAWCDTDNCQRILDVGCGTGLISLMIAQRSPAHIDAIDIDSNACMQALLSMSMASICAGLRCAIIREISPVPHPTSKILWQLSVSHQAPNNTPSVPTFMAHLS